MLFSVSHKNFYCCFFYGSVFQATGRKWTNVELHKPWHELHLIGTLLKCKLPLEHPVGQDCAALPKGVYAQLQKKIENPHLLSIKCLSQWQLMTPDADGTLLCHLWLFLVHRLSWKTATPNTKTSQFAGTLLTCMKSQFALVNKQRFTCIRIFLRHCCGNLTNPTQECMPCRLVKKKVCMPSGEAYLCTFIMRSFRVPEKCGMLRMMKVHSQSLQNRLVCMPLQMYTSIFF